ncbi:hypothetical protein J3P80_12870 [Pseudomonas sp. D2-30]|uniref:hypothetical protein n=1 Tax=unclassified Pseudomonas TaxID=196821 RepID=UPI003DA859F3
MKIHRLFFACALVPGLFAGGWASAQSFPSTVVVRIAQLEIDISSFTSSKPSR